MLTSVRLLIAAGLVAPGLVPASPQVVRVSVATDGTEGNGDDWSNPGQPFAAGANWPATRLP